MVVAFDNKEIRMVCENDDIAKETLGTNMLQDRLADIYAANTVRDLLAGNPTEMEYESLPVYKIEIDGKHALYFSPNHVRTPCLQDGQVDWDKVYRVKVVSIQIK